MPVSDKIVTIIAVLEFYPIAQGADKVAKMHLAA
jgi:hypothetical protein